MKQKHYWDKVAKDKNFTTPVKYDILAKFINKDSKILDYGSGYGRVMDDFYNRGYKNLVGIDISSEMIKRGEKLYPHLNLVLGDGKDIPFEDNTFDVVMILAVFTSVVDDMAIEHLLRETKRVLKPQGIIYINDFLLNTDERNKKRYDKYSRKYGPYGIFELPDGGIMRHFDMKSLEDMIGKFHKLHLEQTAYTTMNGNKSRGVIFLGRNNK